MVIYSSHRKRLFQGNPFQFFTVAFVGTFLLLQQKNYKQLRSTIFVSHEALCTIHTKSISVKLCFFQVLVTCCHHLSSSSSFPKMFITQHLQSRLIWDVECCDISKFCDTNTETRHGKTWKKIYHDVKNMVSWQKKFKITQNSYFIHFNHLFPHII